MIRIKASNKSAKITAAIHKLADIMAREFDCSYSNDGAATAYTTAENAAFDSAKKASGKLTKLGFNQSECKSIVDGAADLFNAALAAGDPYDGIMLTLRKILQMERKLKPAGAKRA